MSKNGYSLESPPISFDNSVEANEKWYILYTYPKAEKVVYSELINRDYNVFLPMTKTLRVWKNRQKKHIYIPLFPNYIFVNTQSVYLYDLIKVPKVVSYISFCNKPSYIGNEEIEAIQRILSLGIINIVVDSELAEGERVRIKSGPLRGHEGILVQRQGKTKFGIQLEEINHTILLDIEKASLEKIA